MIKAFILALQFLTRIPINIAINFSEENLRKSTFFYPIVGIVLGSLSSLPYYLLSKHNIEIASILVVIIMITLTGGLHLDGLSDSADGFFSNKDREKTLEIMKDSRIGAFGVISLILIILFKYILISNFENNLPISLIFSMANARFVTLLQIAFKKVARPGGLGDMLHSSNPRNYIIGGGLLYIGFLIFINPLYLLPLLGSVLMGELISLYSYKKIQGLTGDIYGATIELTEVTSLLLFWGLMIWRL